MYLLFPCCVDEWGSFYNPELVVWGTDMEELKRVGNQWVAEYEDDSVKRYSIRVVKPGGLTEIVYSSDE